MNDFPQSARNVVADWFGDGSWCSKSVLAALAAVVIGLGFWISDIKPGPSQNNIEQTTTDAPKISAREYLAPSAIHQTQSSCVLFGWRAPHEASDWLANL